MSYPTLLWQIAGWLSLCVLLLDALAVEIRLRRVPSGHVIFLTALSMLWHALELVPTGDGFFGAVVGPGGLSFALFGLLTALGLSFPLYLLRVLRRDHVGLAMALGAFCGTHATLNLALFVLMVYAAMAVLASSDQQRFQVGLRHMAAWLESLTPGSRGHVNARGQRVNTMPWTLAVAGGLLVHSLWTYTGMAPLVAW